MKQKKLFSIFIIVLIICIPISIAQSTNTVQSRDTQVQSSSYACYEKARESSSLADSLDNDVIGALESIAAIAYTICSVITFMDHIINVVTSIIGMTEGACCKIPLEIELCKAQEEKFKSWKEMFKPFQGFCCIVSCGWCTGKGCGNIKGLSMDSFTLGAIPDVITPKMEGITEIGQGITENDGEVLAGSQKKGGIGQFHLSPYDNIYTAIGCMCPTAILFNIRKLRTIYQTYDCCVAQSCALGQSTESCEHFLDTSTCMYWEGSIYKMLVNIAMSFLAKFIAKLNYDVIFQNKMVRCLLVFLDIWQTKAVFEQVKSAFDWTKRSFEEPKCSDLGFEDIDPEEYIDTGKAVQEYLDDLAERKSYYFGGSQTPQLRVDADKGIGYAVTRELTPSEVQKLIDKGIKREQIRFMEGGTVILAKNEEEIGIMYPELVSELSDMRLLDVEEAQDLLGNMNDDQIRGFLDGMGIQNADALIRYQISTQDPSSQTDRDKQIFSVIKEFYNDNGIEDPQDYISMLNDYNIQQYLRVEQQGLFDAERTLDLQKARINQEIENFLKEEGYSGTNFEGKEFSTFEKNQDFIDYFKGLKSDEQKVWLGSMDEEQRDKTLSILVGYAQGKVDELINTAGSGSMLDLGIKNNMIDGVTKQQLVDILRGPVTSEVYQTLTPEKQDKIKTILKDSKELELYESQIIENLENKPDYGSAEINKDGEISDLEKKIDGLEGELKEISDMYDGSVKGFLDWSYEQGYSILASTGQFFGVVPTSSQPEIPVDEKIQQIITDLNKARRDLEVLRTKQDMSEEEKLEIAYQQEKVKGLAEELDITKERYESIIGSVPGVSEHGPISDFENVDENFIGYDGERIFPGAYISKDGKIFRVTDNGNLYSIDDENFYDAQGNILETPDTILSYDVDKAPKLGFDNIGGNVGFDYGIQPYDPIKDVEFSKGALRSEGIVIPSGSYVEYDGKVLRVTDKGLLFGEGNFFEVTESGEMITTDRTDTIKGEDAESAGIGIVKGRDFYLSQINADSQTQERLNDYINSLEDEELKKALSALMEGIIDREEFERRVIEIQKQKVYEKLRKYILEQAKYQMAYELLSMSLGEWAYGQIDEMCEQRWESSEPESENNLEYDDSGADPINGETICDTIGEKTSIAASLRKSGTRYSYSFTISSCKQGISYDAYLKKGIDQEEIITGFVRDKDKRSEQGNYYSDKEFDSICIRISPKDNLGEKDYCVSIN